MKHGGIRALARHISRYLSVAMGRIQQWRVNATGRPITFTDGAGFRFWQYPGDRIALNHRRQAVGDSTLVREYIARHIVRGAVCIDIGACIGFVSVPLWAAAGPEGKVISIEADPDNVQLLESNLRLNGASIEWILNVAITNKEGRVKLRRFSGHNGWQTIGNPVFAMDVPSSLVDVAAFPLPVVMERYGLDHVDFIKMDVEGAEPLVLEGMREILAQRRVGQVLFEVNHLMLQGTSHTVEELMSFWKGFDYQLFQVGSNGERVLLSKTGWPEGLVGDCVAVASV